MFIIKSSFELQIHVLYFDSSIKRKDINKTYHYLLGVVIRFGILSSGT